MVPQPTHPDVYIFFMMWYTGENAIVVVPGANDHLTVEDVKNVESLIMSSSVLMCQLEVPIATTLEALKLGKKHRGVVLTKNVKYTLTCFVLVTTMLNAAPASSTIDLGELYNNTNLLCVNETEVRQNKKTLCTST